MRNAASVAALLAITLIAGASNAAPAPSPPPLIAIEPRGASFGGVPLVYGSVTPRTPNASVTVRIVGEPGLSSSALVRWSSPDNKNVFGPQLLDGGLHASPTYEAPANQAVEIYPKGGSVRGDAFVVADVSGPIHARATLLVRDVAGISFGCYAFTTAGPSVRFDHDVARRTSLADADVALVGPGGPNVGGPVPGCSGENYDAAGGPLRLVFRSGGRVFRPGVRPVFVRELPYDAVDSAHPLDVQTHDGSIVRLHVAPAGGTYFVGWAELIDGT